MRFDPGSGQIVSIRADSAQEDTLPEDEIGALMVDRSGLLWVGTLTDGVTTTDPNGARFAFISDSDATHEQRYTNSVRSLYQAPDGALWIGTDGDGVKRYDLASGPVHRLPDRSCARRCRPTWQRTTSGSMPCSRPAGKRSGWAPTSGCTGSILRTGARACSP